MYQFDNPYFLYISLIIPIVIMINFFYMSWRKKIQKSYSNKELLDYISPNRSNFTRPAFSDEYMSYWVEGKIKLELWSI